MKRIVFWLLMSCCVWGLAMPIPALAGGNPTKTVYIPPATVSPVIQSIDAKLNVQDTLNTVVVHINNVAVQIADRYISTAQAQIRLILLIMVPLLGLQIAFDITGGLSGTYRAIGTLFLIWGVVSWTLMDYGQITGWIINGFTTAADILTDSIGMTGASSVDYQGMDQVAQLMIQIRHLPWGVSAGSLLDLNFQPIVDTMITMVFFFIAILIAFITSAISAIFYFLSNVYIDVAIALGPVFLPWALIPWTRKYAQNWIHFLIQGGMYHLVAPVMMDLAAQIFEQVNGQGANITNILVINPQTGAVIAVNFALGLYLIIFSILMGYLMLQIPVVVQSLSSGFFSSSLGSLSATKSSGK